MSPRVSIVIPAYQEADNIESVLQRIHEGVTLPCEVLVVCDTPDDSTIPVVQRFAHEHPYVAALIQPYGRGPANAMRYGFERAVADATVVTMADGSDDVRLIDDMVYLIERGCVVVAASRYMPGGAQVGGPRLKRVMSQTAGLSLSLLAGVTTRDATNSFKAYSTQFVHAVGIESTNGFEVGIELVAKARRLRAPIAELPTIWLDRSGGESNFQMWNWIPSYLKWYRFAFGRPIPSADALHHLTPRNR
jgi:glycosyltransferase involved in cell wall biosynthesis